MLLNLQVKEKRRNKKKKEILIWFNTQLVLNKDYDFIADELDF